MRRCISLAASLLLAMFATSFAGELGRAETQRVPINLLNPSDGPCDRSPLRNPLSKVAALNLALAHNGFILQARQDVEAAIGVAIQTKAIIFPTVSGTGNYRYRSDTLIEQNQNREIATTTATIPGFQVPVLSSTTNREIGRLVFPDRELAFGGGLRPKVNNQDWDAQIRIVQSIYEGGRLLSAVRSSRLTRERAFLLYSGTVADVLLGVSIAYDDVLSTAQQVEVRQASVRLLTAYLNTVKIRESVGDVPEFDVLRAEVETANEEAALVQAIGAHRVAKQVFVELLGYNLPVSASDDLPLNLTTPLQAVPYSKDLSAALTEALLSRTELAAAETEIQLRRESVIVAGAGYKPSVQAIAGYEALSRTQSRNPGSPLTGAFIGLQGSIPIFDGFLTFGRVKEAAALRGRAIEARAETARQIELQVRAAWSDLRTATAVLAAQTKNLEKAKRALGLVEARYNEGAATQVEVLSAQTALTSARTTYVQALRDHSVARARLLRATGDGFQLGTLNLRQATASEPRSQAPPRERTNPRGSSLPHHAKVKPADSPDLRRSRKCAQRGESGRHGYGNLYARADGQGDGCGDTGSASIFRSWRIRRPAGRRDRPTGLECRRFESADHSGAGRSSQDGIQADCPGKRQPQGVAGTACWNR